MGLTDVGRGLGRDLLNPVRELGDYIRAQRTEAQISLRALAERAGVSNPYLSQVERGLRNPSAAILAQIADGLSISVETLLAKAGILRPSETTTPVIDAIHADPTLTDRQKTSLIDVYRALRHEALRDSAPATAPVPDTVPDHTDDRAGGDRAATS